MKKNFFVVMLVVMMSTASGAMHAMQFLDDPYMTETTAEEGTFAEGCEIVEDLLLQLGSKLADIAISGSLSLGKAVLQNFVEIAAMHARVQCDDSE